MAEYLGGIEAGGTKFVCAIGTTDLEIVEEARFPTSTPDETINKCIGFFREHSQKYELKALGVGSFGPIDLNPNSPTYGYVTTTGKPGWQNTNFAPRLKAELGLEVGFDTDVNAPALAEYQMGAAKGLDTFMYLTIGTGIGGGAMVNGKLLHGLGHPEMGHCFIPRNTDSDSYQGKCPFHGSKCFEGLASGPAIAERWGMPAEDLPESHEAWELEAHYIALGLINYIMILSPEKIILGGSVMQQEHLFPMVRAKVQELLNKYIDLPAISEKIDEFIVPASFGNDTGILGALALAKLAHSSADNRS